MAHALCAWKIDVDIIAIDRLIERGLLSERDVDNRHAIELALSRLVADALKLKFGSYVLELTQRSFGQYARTTSEIREEAETGIAKKSKK